MRSLRATLATGAPDRQSAEGREFRRRAHNLRGTGGAYGFPAITETAGRVEDLHLAGGGAARLARAIEALAAAVEAAGRAV